MVEPILISENLRSLAGKTKGATASIKAIMTRKDWTRDRPQRNWKVKITDCRGNMLAVITTMGIHPKASQGMAFGTLLVLKKSRFPMKTSDVGPQPTSPMNDPKSYPRDIKISH